MRRFAIGRPIARARKQCQQSRTHRAAVIARLERLSEADLPDLATVASGFSGRTAGAQSAAT